MNINRFRLILWLGILFFLPISAQTLPDYSKAVYGKVACTDGLAVGFTCNNVDLLSFIPLADLGSPPDPRIGTALLSGSWGWTDPLTGKEYSLAGISTGTIFIDVSNPEKPIVLGLLPVPSTARTGNWREIKTYKNYALIVGDSASQHGIQIFDLTQLRNGKAPNGIFTQTAIYTGVPSVHDIVVNEENGYAYAVGSITCGGGFHIVDMKDPLNPKYVGCFSEPKTGRSKTGYVHDAVCVIYKGPDVAYRGKEICFSSNETHVTTMDMSDKLNIKTLSIATHPNVGYIHQGWLSEDQRYFYVNDELDEELGLVPKSRTLIYDVSKLSEIAFVKEYLGPVLAVDHNLYVIGKYMYQGNYRAGFRLLSLDDSLAPKEIGFFDVYPKDDDPSLDSRLATYTGVWNNYPFFKSGIVVLNSIREGVFIVKPKQGVIRAVPTASVLISPANGSKIVVGGTTKELALAASAPLKIEWQNSTDADGDVLNYTWEISNDPAFTFTLLSQPVGTSTSYSTTIGQINDLLKLLNGGKWSETTLYHRVKVTDGVNVVASSIASVTLTHGYITDTESSDVPSDFRLIGAYPNPFNPSTTITFDLPESATVSLDIFDATGRMVQSYPTQSMSAGHGQRLNVTLANVPSGVYMYRLTANFSHKTQLLTGKLNLLK